MVAVRMGSDELPAAVVQPVVPEPPLGVPDAAPTSRRSPEQGPAQEPEPTLEPEVFIEVEPEPEQSVPKKKRRRPAPAPKKKPSGPGLDADYLPPSRRAG